MKRVFCALIFVGLLGQFAAAQVEPLANPAHAAASARVMKKYHEVMLLGQLLPINFSQSQWNKVLDAVEAAREQVRKTEENEYNVLIGDEGMLDDMIDAALKKDQEPDVKKIAKFQADLKALGETRAIFAAGNVTAVFDAVKKVGHVGQLHEMENSLNINLIDPSKDPKKMTEDEKLRFFVKTILLDPDAYPLMVKLSVKASLGK